MRKIYLGIQSLVALLLLGLSLNAKALPADYQAYPTDAELDSLPAYCRIKLRHRFDSPEYKKAQASFGPDFEHVHHYCAGLNFINRYYRTSDTETRKFFLKSSVGEFDYMVTHAKPEFSLMPEIYLSRGTSYSLMKKDFQAMNDINKALELNPRMIKGYRLLSEFYENIKQKQKALEVVTAGLQYNPDSKMLQSRYLELGGKLPYPEPIQQTMPEKEKEPATDKKSNAEEKSSADNPDTSPPPSTQAPENSTDQPKIGSPSNPYCRFCTD